MCMQDRSSSRAHIFSSMPTSPCAYCTCIHVRVHLSIPSCSGIRAYACKLMKKGKDRVLLLAHTLNLLHFRVFDRVVVFFFQHCFYWLPYSVLHHSLPLSSLGFSFVRLSLAEECLSYYPFCHSYAGSVSLSRLRLFWRARQIPTVRPAWATKSVSLGQFGNNGYHACVQQGSRADTWALIQVDNKKTQTYIYIYISLSVVHYPSGLYQ